MSDPSDPLLTQTPRPNEVGAPASAWRRSPAAWVVLALVISAVACGVLAVFFPLVVAEDSDFQFRALDAARGGRAYVGELLGLILISGIQLGGAALVLRPGTRRVGGGILLAIGVWNFGGSLLGIVFGPGAGFQPAVGRWIQLIGGYLLLAAAVIALRIRDAGSPAAPPPGETPAG